MDKYLGVKIISAEPMTADEFNEKVRPLRTSFEDRRGYKVAYEDGGHESWSPKEVFERAYRKISELTFGLAIEAMKRGLRVARKGWNGKGMWLELQRPDEHSKMSLPYIYMSTVTGDLVPWLASQTDMLAEDWEVVE